MVYDGLAGSELMRRLWTDALAAPDDAAGQASLARAARMLAFKLANEGTLDVADDWVSIDAHHDFVQQRWREMGMPPVFEWVAAWTPEPVSRASEAVELCVIRRRHPMPNGAYLVRVPFEKVRAAEGFTFHVIGVVVPLPVSPDFWQLESVVFEALDMRVGIGTVAEVGTAMTTTGLEEVTRYFDLAHKPDAKTLTRARRALTMRPKHAGGSPKGPRKAREWDRRRILEYCDAASAFGEPDLAGLAAEMGVHPDTARKRVEQAGLQWPPTPAELDELNR